MFSTNYRSCNSVSLLIYCFILLSLFIHSLPVFADEAKQSEFKNKIISAFKTADKESAILSLFYLEEMDDKTRGIYKILAKRLGKKELPQITFAKLPPDFNPLYVLDGYEYKPNLKPLGQVALKHGEQGSETKITYGEKDGKYYFPGVIKILVNADAKPDKTLQIIVIGIAHPPLRFSGYCDIMQSNNKIRRMELEDSGNGNQTVLLRGQYIEECEVTNDSQTGSISLRLLEDDQSIIEYKIESPETKIIYLKKKHLTYFIDGTNI